MTTWYYISDYGSKPEAKEFVRETEKTLFDVKGRRIAKHNSWQHYYRTEQEALDHIQRVKECRDSESAKRKAEKFAMELLEALEACAGFADRNGMVNGVNILAAIAKARGEK